MITGISSFQKVFFIGVAGTGMSAVAQYLAGIGKSVAGSDRFFKPGIKSDIQQQLEDAGIGCFLQTGEGIAADTELVVVSTAIEDTVFEVQKARELKIPIIKRSALLALIAESKRTIAVAGTSGKSTTCAMLFDILSGAGMNPSIISGAGLVSIIKKGKIGNAHVGKGEWLVIEADESDGSIVQYHPEVGLLLNIDKDHQEIQELRELFTIFRKNTTRLFSVNQSNLLSSQLSVSSAQDFTTSGAGTAAYLADNFNQQGFTITFDVAQVPFKLNTVGRHNMENALAATCIANQLGVPLKECATALQHYEGIHRRHQVLGKVNGTWVIDDYAHNPAKCAASIAACQYTSSKVVAWFQPHGYGPTRFLRSEFVKEIAGVLRPADEIWMSEIYYAGGTAVKDISSADLIADLRAAGCNAGFVPNRNDLVKDILPHLQDAGVLLLMGARDPGLEQFGQQVLRELAGEMPGPAVPQH